MVIETFSDHSKSISITFWCKIDQSNLDRNEGYHGDSPGNVTMVLRASNNSELMNSVEFQFPRNERGPNSQPADLKAFPSNAELPENYLNVSYHSEDNINHFASRVPLQLFVRRRHIENITRLFDFYNDVHSSDSRENNANNSCTVQAPVAAVNDLRHSLVFWLFQFLRDRT